MARITIEDCLEQVNNRFALVTLCANRTKQLMNGAKPLVRSDNKAIVSALREVAAGRVRPGIDLTQVKRIRDDI
jgi:DNA-directed RNA polymerase subunit omega